MYAEGDNGKTIVSGTTGMTQAEAMESFTAALVEQGGKVEFVKGVTH